MGRKIPKSKRHKKLKFVDPCYSGPGPRGKKKRLLDNEPPTAGDEQAAPRQAAEIMELKTKVKHNQLRRKKKKKKPLKDDFIVVKNTIIDKDQPGVEGKVKNVPSEVRQKKNESEYKFFNRLQKMVNTAIAEAKVEDKYNIQLLDVDKSGNAKYVAEDKEVSNRKKEKRKKQKEKLAEKKRLKRDDGEFDLKKERVQFGDVVSAPPMLKARPKRAPQLDKAGKRELQLKSLLQSGPGAAAAGVNVAPLTKNWKNSNLDKTVKSVKNAEIEKERLRAIQMYRLLKKNKRTQ